MNGVLRLIAIDRDGTHIAVREEMPFDVITPTVQMYARTGFESPWIGYLAVDNGGVCVGTCAFKGVPQDGRVEISYFTFPCYEGRGYATWMAHALVDLARNVRPDISVTAQTLPEKNASTTILEKIGFELVGTVDHPEDGLVWQWELPPMELMA
jgi:ribosomal-protein-alanine N-acetyltransferase